MPRELPEWIGKTDNSRIPDRVRVRKFLQADGRCQWCERRIASGEVWHLDHRVALVNGGNHREGNLQVLCQWCHGGKTRKDVAEKSKTERKRRANLGVKRQRSITGWRRFDGTPVRAARER